jgi:hypothetical protein
MTDVLMSAEFCHPAFRVLNASVQMAPAEWLTTSIQAYAWDVFRYVLTPRDVEDILSESCWNSIDDYVTYMQAVNFSDRVPGTTNGTLPRGLRIYRHEELDDLWVSLCDKIDAEDGLGTASEETVPHYNDKCGDVEAMLDIYDPPSFQPNDSPPQYSLPAQQALPDKICETSTESETAREQKGVSEAETNMEAAQGGRPVAMCVPRTRIHEALSRSAQVISSNFRAIMGSIRRVHFRASQGRTRRLLRFPD